jgi:hypothetical protein
LQPDDDEGHDGFDDAELHGGLLAEAQEADVVRPAREAARPVEPARLDRLAPKLNHDHALSAQVLEAQGQETVDDEGCNHEKSKTLLRFSLIVLADLPS